MQVTVLTVFYLFSALIDWFLSEFGSRAVRDGHITCVNDKFLIVADNWGGLYALCVSCSFYLYAFVTLSVFYLIPRHYGVVTDNFELLIDT